MVHRDIINSSINIINSSINTIQERKRYRRNYHYKVCLLYNLSSVDYNKKDISYDIRPIFLEGDFTSSSDIVEELPDSIVIDTLNEDHYPFCLTMIEIAYNKVKEVKNNIEKKNLLIFNISPIIATGDILC